MIEPNPFYHIPDEIFFLISSHLPIPERISFSGGCRHLYKLIRYDLMQYDPTRLASKILKIYKGPLSATQLANLCERKFLISLENKLFKRLKFTRQSADSPNNYLITFETRPPKKFKIYEYNQTINSKYFNIQYNPNKNKFRFSKNSKNGYLRFKCSMSAQVFTTTAKVDHRDMKEGEIILNSTINENYVIREKVYFKHFCIKKVEKAKKFQTLKVIKSPQKSHIKIVQNINNIICFHLVSFIETVARYNLQFLREYQCLRAFGARKSFPCSERGKISNGLYAFELYAKKIKWFEEKEIVTLRWNDPGVSVRYSEGNYLNHLRHAVFSRTTELFLNILGLPDF